MINISAPLQVHARIKEKAKGEFSLEENHIETADIIVYIDDLTEMLINSHLNNNVNHIISFKNFEKDGLIKEPDLNLFTTIFNLNFKEESISEVRKKLDESLEKQSFIGYFSDIKRYLHSISLELVQNAIIVGRQKDHKKIIDYQLKETSDSWLIEVKDFYGTLTRRHVLEKLSRACSEKSFEEKETGAGLGFYMLLGACDKLIFEIKEKKETRISVIINKYKRLKDYKNKNISIHFLNNVGE